MEIAIAPSLCDMLNSAQVFCINETTWNTLLAVYESLLAGPPLTTASRPAYPGKAQRQGSVGAPVRQVQQWLNRLAMGQECVPYLEEDGVFGTATEQAVQRFQAACGLEECGQVQSETWAALRLAAGNGHDPGTILRLISSRYVQSGTVT